MTGATPHPPAEVLPGLYFFERGYLNGNHFAATGPEPVLVDTGYADGWPETRAHLAAVGIEPASVARIVSTHLHCDHVGGNPAIQAASGCRAVLHAAGVGLVARGDRVATWWDYYHQKGEFFPVAAGVEDGDEIALGDHRFTVIHVPGHAPDLIALYHPREKILLSSDALWGRGLAVVTPQVEGDDAAQRWLASLTRLASLDVRRVYPGHGAPFEDFRAAIARTESRLGQYRDDPCVMADDLLRKITVYTLLMTGPEPEPRFRERLLASRWFPATVDRWFGGAREEKYGETVAHLVRRGSVVRDGGLLRTPVRP